MALTRRGFLKITGGSLAALSILPMTSKVGLIRPSKIKKSPIWFSGTPRNGCSGWIMENDDRTRLLHQIVA